MQMGRIDSNKKNQFRDVSMARKKPSADDAQINAGEKERLINNVTGYKPKNGLYVDGEKHNKMGKDEFLKLLTYQLQNQDPLKPMEQSQMAGELAQFSQLEQLSNLNSKFEKMGNNQKVEDKFYGASFLGKEIVTNGTSLDLTEDGGKADVLFSIEKPAAKVLVRIFDKKNAMVGEMWRENIGRGSQTVSWDGISLDGQTAAEGEYRVQVYAWDKTSEPIVAHTKVKGTVESVFFENGETVLKVDGKKVFLRDVDSFHASGKGKFDKAAGNNTASAFAGIEASAPSSNAARNVAQNLPLAQNIQSKVNLNKLKQQAGKSSYGMQGTKQPAKVGTGITNVYDVE
jgi:flagellar basal-body rod modification protein FlgD